MINVITEKNTQVLTCDIIYNGKYVSGKQMFMFVPELSEMHGTAFSAHCFCPTHPCLSDAALLAVRL